MSKKGFTLIELLIVIAIIAILAGVVFVSLDPLSRFRDARDAARYTDVTAILSAIKVDQVDNKGPYTTELENTTDGDTLVIGTDTTGCDYSINTGANCRVDTDDVACLDLTDLVTSGYLGKMPVNPNGNGAWTEAKTGYYLTKNTNGSVTVGSCDTESTALIEVTR